jgi:acetyl-CoA C-acetyltransferase
MIGSIGNRRSVYIVDGSRTPFLKAKGKPGPFSASDLAVATCRELLLRQNFAPSDLDEVITGCVMPSCDEANISRIISLRLGCGKQVPAWTVQRNCASGLQSIDSAMKDIAIGRHDLVLAGGTDAMSHAPLLYNKTMVNWFADWMFSKSASAKTKLLLKFPLANVFNPVITLARGLTDPLVGLSMGQTAEQLAYRFNVTREEMDNFAVRSHQRLLRAQQQGPLPEITPIYDAKGNIYTHDDGIRVDSNVEKLATLKPFFDRKYGMVTPANSSQVTDGAAFVILASKTAVDKYNLPILGRISAVQWAGVDPAEMGLGPVHSIVPMLQRMNLRVNDIDYCEINESFAAQVIACQRAMASDIYCRNNFGLEKAFGAIDEEKLNTDGGAIAIGHPVGASGARLVLHIVESLQKHKVRRGVASLCIGGGQGGAILVENTSEV